MEVRMKKLLLSLCLIMITPVVLADAQQEVMCAELAGDFHLGDSRQLTDKSLLPFDLVS